jgi:heterokaryon incompatibility protein (HET)
MIHRIQTSSPTTCSPLDSPIIISVQHRLQSAAPLINPRTGPDIRLLRLLKGVRHYDDDPIRCELFEAPLPEEDDDEAYYDALSYTWGDAAQTSNIVIDGRPATVTANLYQALRHLRITDEDCILWVDVWINQGERSERMH